MFAKGGLSIERIKALSKSALIFYQFPTGDVHTHGRVYISQNSLLSDLILMVFWR